MASLIVAVMLFGVVYLVGGLIWDFFFPPKNVGPVRDDTPNFMWFHFD